jgi:serine/threonine protein kinase
MTDNLERSAGDGAGLDLRTEFWNRLEPILELFERALSRGERPALEAFLPALRPAERRALLAELAHAELEFRLKAAEPARVEDYLTRYPELRSDPDVLEGLIRAEYRVRRQREHGLGCAEYEARFPKHGAGWATLLAEVPGPEADAGEGRPARVAAGSESVEAGAGPRPAPARLGDFRILHEIGRGGMGVVYRARDTTLARDIAVKLLSERYPTDSPVARRFLSEARITGQLQHPGIPAVHQVGTLADGRPFLAMKLIKGSTLEDILKQRPDPSAERGRLLAIFEAVCQAVGYAHAHRVIHRDLKPANVMVGAFGEVQVMDWGLAKVLGQETPSTVEALSAEQTQAWTEISPTPEAGSHTQAGSLVGTPAFIAPEQALGEIERVNERSDVFGLGALLAVVLTGKPPYVGETFEAVRVQAVRGKLDDCFARLDASGAEPELVALCKKCLAFEPADRPADAGAVAHAVAGLRAAADERARRAEVEQVRALGEQAMAEAQAAERRKRRRMALLVAAVLAVAAVGGLTAVVVVQRRANSELADEQAKVEARYALAEKAIKTFHTGVSEDALLKNDNLKALRTKLLGEAVGFYKELEGLLAGQTDAKSRRALAAAYFQLGELMDRIGSKPEALAVHRMALALRRELAAAEGANVESRLDVARSLHAVGWQLQNAGNSAEALLAYQEERDLAAALEAESPTDTVRAQLAHGHFGIGSVLDDTGKPDEALDSGRMALAIYEGLPEAGQYQQPGLGPMFGLQLQAAAYSAVGYVLYKTGKVADALESLRKASDIMEKLANANPVNIPVQEQLGISYGNLTNILTATGRLDEAMAAHSKALNVIQKLADAHPAVTEFQRLLSYCHASDGDLLVAMGKPEQAIEPYRKFLAINQKLVDANPKVPLYQNNLALAHSYMGRLLAQQAQFAEAFTAMDNGLAMLRKLVEANPKTPQYTTTLAFNHAWRGWALIRSGQPSKAATYLRQALELWAKDPAPGYADMRFERSRALALLAGLGGLGDEAKSGVTKDEAAAFADQAVAALGDAITGGWLLLDDLKEPDFNAIRGREEFKKLVAVVKAKAGPKAKPNE